MKLRNLSIFICCAILFIWILNFYLNFFRFPFSEIDLFDAIPDHSTLIIECNDIESLNAMNPPSPLWNSIRQTAIFGKLQKDLFEVKTRLLNHKDSTAFFEGNRFIAALQMSSAKTADFLYIIDSDGIEINEDLLFQQMENVKIIKSVFLKESVYELLFPDNQRFAVSFCKNLILVARFPFMVEDAIAQLHHPKNTLSGKQNFRQIKKSIKGNPGASIYFELSKIQKLLNRSSQNFEFANIVNIGDLAILNFYAKGGEVIVDGSLIGAADLDFKQGIVNASDSKIDVVIPDNCSFLFWQSRDISSFKKAYKNDDFFKKYLEPWIGDETAVFFTESRKTSLKEEQFVVFKMKDRSLAKEYLDDYAESEGEMEEADYQTFKIKQLLSNEILRASVFFENSELQTPFYTLIDDFVIFTDSRQSLEVLIDKYILSQTLINNASFLQFQSNLQDNSNSFLYCNIPLFTPFLRQISLELEHEKIDDFFDILYNFKSLGIQLNYAEKQSELKFYFNASDDLTQPTKIIWSAELAANAIIPPAVLRNTENDQNVVFIQDAQSRIYLFDRKGNVIWRRKLKSPIISEIHQIQYYGNAENQILFNTENQLFIIDFEGKDVGVYPLKLTAPASNGICVIDFENDKDYQFFVGSQNGSIYGFEKIGEPLEGWNPKKNVGKLIHDIQHFQVAGNDYILAITEKSNFHAFKRNGEERFEPVSFSSKYLSPPAFQVFDKTARIVLSNQSGKAQVFNIKGKYFNLHVGTGKGKNVKFLFSDIIGDKRKDYISLSGRDLSCYYYEKSSFKRAFKMRFEYPQDELFSVQIKGEEKLQIATLNRKNKKISLLKNDGSLRNGFPLSGTSKFTVIDLFDTGGNVLVVALDNKIYTSKVD